MQWTLSSEFLTERMCLFINHKKFCLLWARKGLRFKCNFLKNPWIPIFAPVLQECGNFKTSHVVYLHFILRVGKVIRVLVVNFFDGATLVPNVSGVDKN